ncbi:MAG: gliding motility lipoprotein GldH [Rikenellaceae bacterium]|nr:gliding motility lipoprotein GldH [Rikenellaceae bacterium]
MSSKIKPGCFILVILMFAACSREKNLYFTGIDSSGWDSSEPAYIFFDNSDTVSVRELTIFVRTTELFKYDKINLTVETMDPGRVYFTDTISINIIHGNSGDTEVIYRSNVRLMKQGEYRVKFNHLLPETEVSGISGLGVKVKDNGKE